VEIPFNDLRAQYLSLKEEIDRAVASVLDSGWFILGQQVEAFEAEFAAYCGVRFAVGVGNGTQGLQLALMACGVEAGDEVITTPMTAVFTTLAISAIGATPVLVDIDPETYNLDPSHLVQAITPRTRTILPVHLYGQCADMDPVLAIARDHGLTVVEDACQAHGAKYKGSKTGSMGDAGVFSFYPTKNLGAYGDGGIVVTDDEQIAENVRLLHNGGQRERYRHIVKGFNSRLDELQAAILRVGLRHLDCWNDIRRQRATLYETSLKNARVTTPAEREYAEHVYHLYVVRSQKRDALRSFLKAHGVGTLVHYAAPVHLQEAYRDHNFRAGDFPVAEAHAREALSLPMHPFLGETQISQICNLIGQFEMTGGG
jgi:dTDP-4-amino-4,6-dideoxygalactose transaminase